MRPRGLSARVGLIFCVVILSVASIDFTGRAVGTQAGLLAYCASTPDQSDIYITQIFNTGLDPAVNQDTDPLQNEYIEYLKGRFDVKSNSNFPVTCPLSFTMSQAQSSKQNYEMQMRQGNKHIVQLQWNYRPQSGTAIAPTAAIPQHRMPRVNTAQADHTFCISDVYQNAVYVTGPVATPPPVAMYAWANGFTDFLKGKYSFEGRVYCNMGTTKVRSDWLTHILTAREQRAEKLSRLVGSTMRLRRCRSRGRLCRMRIESRHKNQQHSLQTCKQEIFLSKRTRV